MLWKSAARCQALKMLWNQPPDGGRRSDACACLESVPAGKIWGRYLRPCLSSPAVRLDHLKSSRNREHHTQSNLKYKWGNLNAPNCLWMINRMWTYGTQKATWRTNEVSKIWKKVVTQCKWRLDNWNDFKCSEVKLNWTKVT
jgi:hypothetical protein